MTIIAETTPTTPPPAPAAWAAVRVPTWSVHPDATVSDLADRAEALGVKVALLVDFEAAQRRITSGGFLPDWADDFEVGEDEIFIRGTHGNVRLGVALVYGVHSAATSRKISVDIDHTHVGEMTAAEIRSLAANLELAAHAVERSTKAVYSSPDVHRTASDGIDSRMES